jgi:lipopolysaccharide transport system permease protein
MPVSPHAPATVAYRTTARRAGALSELWAYRELLGSLVERQLKAKYQRSALGFLWTLLNPLLMLAVLTLVFSSVIRVPMERYWAFLISGYFAWNYFSQMLSSSTYVLLENGQLTRSVHFPAEAPVLAAAVARLVEFAIEVAMVVVIIVIWHFGRVPASFALLPLLVVLQVLMSLGLVLPLATMSLFFKDIGHALPVALTLLFYISPVFYPMGMVPDWAGWLLWCNPLAWLLTLYHQVLYEGRMPSAAVLGGAVAWTVIMLPLGYAFFSRYKRLCAELI